MASRLFGIGIGALVVGFSSGVAITHQAGNNQPEKKPQPQTQPKFNPADPYGVGIGVHDKLKELGWMVGTWDVEE